MKIKQGIPEDLIQHVLDFTYPNFKHLMSRQGFYFYLKGLVLVLG